jgi:hypothetical protein
MQYPIGFPIQFQASLNFALAKARNRFFEKAHLLPKPRNFSVRDALEQLMKERVKTGVAEFGELACKAVKEGLWPADQAGPAMQGFLETIARAAYNDADDLYDHRFYYSYPDLEREITTSDEWLGYLKEFAKGPQPEPSKAIAKFFTPPGAQWPDISIRFTSDLRLQIDFGQMTETRNFEEMGFADQRGGEKVRPRRAWAMLLRLAKRGGRIGTRNLSSSVGEAGITKERIEVPEGELARGRVALEKRIEEIRERLRHVFSLEGDPIPFIKDASGWGYQAQFKIYYPASEHGKSE